LPLSLVIVAHLRRSLAPETAAVRALAFRACKGSRDVENHPESSSRGSQPGFELTV